MNYLSCFSSCRLFLDVHWFLYLYEDSKYFLAHQTQYQQFQFQALNGSVQTKRKKNTFRFFHDLNSWKGNHRSSLASLERVLRNSCVEAQKKSVLFRLAVELNKSVTILFFIQVLRIMLNCPICNLDLSLVTNKDR